MVWWLWMIVALVLGIVELMSTTFVLMWIAIAGVVTAVLSVFEPIMWIQVSAFAVVSAVLLAVTRPVVQRWKGKQTVPSPSERMVGKTGIVITVPADEQLGTVRVAGELWSATSDEELQVGSHVTVTKADSSVLVVRTAGK